MITFKRWIFIFGLWTLAAASMTTQFYFSLRSASYLLWFQHFLKQIACWYLWALLTPLIIWLYNKYPVGNINSRKNIYRQVGYAMIILSVFSNIRLIVMHYSIGPGDNLHTINYFNRWISQMSWDAGIYFFLFTIIFSYKTYSQKKQKELHAAQVELANKELQYQLHQAKMEALKMQLSPHFLFNTLNTVSALIRTGEYKAAVQVNARLGDFLRKTLHTENNGFVAFEEELKFIELYLQIEMARFGDRLQIFQEVQHECRHLKIPHLLLQPIFENALKHGIAKHIQAKELFMKVCCEEGVLCITVFNEGERLPFDWKMEENLGIGLGNILNRLKIIYPGNFLFTVANHPEREGVLCQINIPAISYE